MLSTNTFNDRNNITKIIENDLNHIFDDDDIILIPFGVSGITHNNSDIYDYIRNIDVNHKPASLIIKFAPDYLLLKKSDPKELYFLEIKCSITPCWSDNRKNKITQKHPDANISNIGEIAREALLSYRRYYPNTIILYGCPYNKKVLMAQFAENIECLYCYKSEGEYDCSNCPSKNGGFFELERNQNSTGSGTPNTNINLDKFEPIDIFFKRLQIPTNIDKTNLLCQKICDVGIRFGDNVNTHIRRQIANDLIDNYECTWIKRPEQIFFISLDNDFYHADPNCFCIKSNSSITELHTEQEAIRLGKHKCKYCHND